MVSDAPDAIFDQWHIEIDEKSERFARKFKIRDELGLMNCGKLADSFQFDNDLVINKQIDPIACINHLAIVVDGLNLLPFHLMTSFDQLVF